MSSAACAAGPARALCAAVGVFASGEFFSVACAFLWSVATVLFRKGGETVPPVALNLFKTVVALAFFLPTLVLLGIALFPEDHGVADWLILMASGAIGIGIADTLFFAGLNRIGAGRMAIAEALYSPAAMLFAFALLGEPIGFILIAAMGLMVAAIVIGNWEPWEVLSAEDRRRVVLGVLFGVLSVVFVAAAIAAVKPILDRSDPWWSTTVRVLGGTIWLSVQGLLPRHRAHVARAFRPGRQWMITLPASILGTYVAMIMWIAGMTYANVSVASILNQTATLFTPVLGVVVLRERMTIRKASAVVMAFSGAVLVLA